MESLKERSKGKGKAREGDCKLLYSRKNKIGALKNKIKFLSSNIAIATIVFSLLLPLKV